VTIADPPPVQRDAMRLVAFSDAVLAITHLGTAAAAVHAVTPIAAARDFVPVVVG
jgi:hypothetical protein